MTLGSLGKLILVLDLLAASTMLVVALRDYRRQSALRDRFGGMLAMLALAAVILLLGRALLT